MSMRCNLFLLVLFVSFSPLSAEDWPTFRQDASRSGYSSEALDNDLTVDWVYRDPYGIQSAWPRSQRMLFDKAFRPVVSKGLLFFGSPVTGKVTAMNVTTGREQWTFFAEGPVRMAPTVWKDSLFITSDDGFLYSLSITDGSLQWKHRGGPQNAMVLGNEHIVSKWAARGGAVVVDGIVYFGAGVWSTEGFYLTALNAATGEVVWVNDDSGSLYISNPHQARAKSAVAAQGHLAASKDHIIVPTGRGLPAVFLREDGKYQVLELARYGSLGGDQIMIRDNNIVADRIVLDTSKALAISNPIAGYFGTQGSMTNSKFVFFHPEGIVAQRAEQFALMKIIETEDSDRKGGTIKARALEDAWAFENPFPPSTCLIGAKDSIISGWKDGLGMIDIPSQEVRWTHKVEGTVHDLVVAGGRLFASTDAGLIYCFAAAGSNTQLTTDIQTALVPEGITQTVKALIEKSNVRKGYCLDLGCGDGSLAMELARQTDLYVVAVDNDLENVRKVRRRFYAAGLLGSRVAVIHRDLDKTGLPDYFANLVVSSRSLLASAAMALAEAERVQKPYDGVLVSGSSSDMKMTIRPALAGSGSWTHQYANPGNTLCSDDDLVKGVLSILWYKDVAFALPQRHGRPPSPLFKDGRLIHGGIDGLIAVDAYNGHTLWTYEIKDFLTAYDTEQLMGTSGTGGNVCLGDEHVYARHGNVCYKIFAQTGRLSRTYTLPGGTEKDRWGFIAYADGILFGSFSNPNHIVLKRWGRSTAAMPSLLTESHTFFAIDAESGKLLWQYKAKHSIRHNAIAIGPTNVYLIDRPLAVIDTRYFGKEEEAPRHEPGTLIAFDRNTGKVAWDNSDNIYGTVLILSPRHNSLLMCYQPQHKWKLPSEKPTEATNMALFDIAGGSRIWDRQIPYTMRPIVNDDKICLSNGCWDLMTGDAPEVQYRLGFGCGAMSSSKHMTLFRKGTLGYSNFDESGEARFFGGMRPGCWINVIPAGGIVLTPNGSTGCRCSYLNESWLALQPLNERNDENEEE